MENLIDVASSHVVHLDSYRASRRLQELSDSSSDEDAESPDGLSSNRRSEGATTQPTSRSVQLQDANGVTSSKSTLRIRPRQVVMIKDVDFVPEIVTIRAGTGPQQHLASSYSAMLQ